MAARAPAACRTRRFCADHHIAPDVEVLPSARVEEALDRLAGGDVRYRFVLDMSDLDAPAA